MTNLEADISARFALPYTAHCVDFDFERGKVRFLYNIFLCFFNFKIIAGTEKNDQKS